MAADPRPPVAVDTALGTVLVPAAVMMGPAAPPLPPGVGRQPVVWHQPLPANARKFLPPEVAAAVVGNAAAPPLPVGAPPADADVEPAAFQPRQYGELYRLLHQHAQLLIQVYVMAAASLDPTHREVAQQARAMAEGLHQFSVQQSAERQAQVRRGSGAERTGPCVWPAAGCGCGSPGDAPFGPRLSQVLRPTPAPQTRRA